MGTGDILDNMMNKSGVTCEIDGSTNTFSR